MRSWSTTATLRAQVQRWWDRGDVLRAAIEGDTAWPRRLTLTSPTVADMADRFGAVREWVRTMDGVPHVRIEWHMHKHRIHGLQRMPASAWVDSAQDAAGLLGTTREVQRFTAIWQATAAAHASLLSWVRERPLRALEVADSWTKLLGVVDWMRANPRPGAYLRHVSVPGVDSKFIEGHRGVLAELLDLSLPAAAIEADARGATRFARRFGFLEKPVRIRFRVLDPAIASLPGCDEYPDITLDSGSFAKLALPVQHVFITENETNFLAFPPVAQAIVVFGAGYGWEALARAAWLRRCRVHYWGDIDTHGFAILDQLRVHVPAVASVMMDRATLLAHVDHWGEEPEPVRSDLARLTAEESVLYDDLRFDRIQARLRLEQERISFTWACGKITKITATA